MRITAHIIADIIGTPEEHVKKTAALLKQKLEAEETFTTENITIHPPVTEDGVTSILVEYDATFPSFERYITFLIEYMPASVEITDPESITLQAADLNTLTSEFLAYLHEYDKAVKQKLSESVILEKKFDQLLVNLILLAIGQGPTPKETIVERTGVDVKSLTPILLRLVQQGLITYTPQGYKVKRA